MTSPACLKDLADVQELIKVLDLSEDFSEQLNPFVRAKYNELRTGAKMDSTEIESDSWGLENDEPGTGPDGTGPLS